MATDKMPLQSPPHITCTLSNTPEFVVRGMSIIISLTIALTLPSPSISATVTVTVPVSPSGNGTLAETILDPFTRLRLTPGRDSKDTRQPSPVAPLTKIQEIIADDKFVCTTVDCKPVVAMYNRNRVKQNQAVTAYYT